MTLNIEWYKQKSWQIDKAGLTPKLHIMDNELSEGLKQYFE